MKPGTSYKFINLFFLAILSMLLAACGGGGSNSSTDNNSTLQTNSINENLKTIFSKILSDQRFPSEFYKEPKTSSELFTTIKHISNHDISLYDVSFSYPLCEENFSDALAKSETEATGSDTTLVDNTDNNWYYEFSRAKISNANSIHTQRIYKCETYNVSSTNNYKGQYNSSIINAEDYLKFIEYQWYFSFNNNYGNIVLDSKVNTSIDGVTSAIIINAKISNIDNCYEIDIIENYYDLNNTTREINRYEIVTDTFSARKENNAIEICL